MPTWAFLIFLNKDLNYGNTILIMNIKNKYSFRMSILLNSIQAKITISLSSSRWLVQNLSSSNTPFPRKIHYEMLREEKKNMYLITFYTLNLSWQTVKPSSSHSLFVTSISGKCADRLMAAPPRQLYVVGLQDRTFMTG